MSLGGNDTEKTGLGNVDTTTSENFTVTVTWDNKKAGNIMSIYQGLTEWKN